MKKVTGFMQPMAFTGNPADSTWAGYSFLQWTGDTFHPGLDYNYGNGDADKGKPVYCVANGYVEKILKWDNVTKGFGNHVFIKHTMPDGTILYSHYCHLDTISCSEGVDIDYGAQIGTCGKSGGWEWAHLHFELRKPIGKGYEFWPKPKDGYSKEWIAENYYNPYIYIQEHPLPNEQSNPLTALITISKTEFEQMKMEIARQKDVIERQINDLALKEEECKQIQEALKARIKEKLVNLASEI